jgi:hypothetical protein
MSNLGQTPKGLFFGLAVPLLFITLQVCLPLDARPDSDLNPLESLHTITADVDADVDELWLAVLWVDFGPNAGENSMAECHLQEETDDCAGEIAATIFDCLFGSQSFEEFVECLTETVGAECQPDCVDFGDESVSWSYRGEGGPGTDYIIVCALDIGVIESAADLEAFFNGTQVGTTQLFFDEEPSEEEIEAFESATDCDVVTKTWEDETLECPLEEDELDELSEDEFDELASELGITNEELEELCDFVLQEEDEDEDESPRPNVAGLFAGDVGAAQRNRERARASVAPATAQRPAETTPIRPPSTGDAGLR